MNTECSGRAASAPVVTLRGAVKDYPSGGVQQRVLRSIDLDIYESELLVILGESGCGKTTLLNLLGGMDRLTEGSLTAFGKDLSSPAEETLTDYRRNDVGFVFQAYHLMPNLTAWENVELIAEHSADAMDSLAALELVGLDAKAGSYPFALSAGQQQRVAIARAIVKKPRLILADEPTAALDLRTGREVLKVIRDVVREQGISVVMATHNAEIAKMADRVVRLQDGRIAEERRAAQPLSAAELSW